MAARRTARVHELLAATRFVTTRRAQKRVRRSLHDVLKQLAHADARWARLDESAAAAVCARLDGRIATLESDLQRWPGPTDEQRHAQSAADRERNEAERRKRTEPLSLERYAVWLGRAVRNSHAGLVCDAVTDVSRSSERPKRPRKRETNRNTISRLDTYLIQKIFRKSQGGL